MKKTVYYVILWNVLTRIDNINDKDKIDNTTYNEKFLVINSDIIIKKIKLLYRQKHLYTKKEIKQNVNQKNIPRRSNKCSFRLFSKK